VHIPPDFGKIRGKKYDAGHNSRCSGTVPRGAAGVRRRWYSAPMLPARTPEHRPITGRYVRLEQLALEHAAELFAISDHPDRDLLYRYLPDEPIASLVDSSRWIADKLAANDPLFFVCVDNGSGQVLGRQALMRITPAHGVIEIGNILWGPGMARSRLATESLFLMAGYVFDELGYRRFEWKCDAQNEPSRRAALRFGFRFEGIFHQHMWIKGKNRDTAWYAMLDSDWPGLRAAYDRWLAPGNFDDAGRQRMTLAVARGGST
jgi:RimJ/RimL family protein N-acetyltransferase